MKRSVHVWLWCTHIYYVKSVHILYTTYYCTASFDVESKYSNWGFFYRAYCVYGCCGTTLCLSIFIIIQNTYCVLHMGWQLLTLILFHVVKNCWSYCCCRFFFVTRSAPFPLLDSPAHTTKKRIQCVVVIFFNVCLPVTFVCLSLVCFVVNDDGSASHHLHICMHRPKSSKCCMCVRSEFQIERMHLNGDECWWLCDDTIK